MTVRLEMSENKQRNPYFQYVRGICIIMVVLIHSRAGIPFQGTAYSWNFDYWLVLRQTINFPVATFVFLSGYFTNVDRLDTGSNRTQYLLQRITRLYLPFFVWSFIYSAVNKISNGFNSSIFKEIVILFVGLSSGQLYYILVLIQLTILSPLLIKTIKMNRFIKLMFAITPIYLVALYAYAIFFGHQFKFYATIFPAWFLFYYFGLYVRIKGFPQIFHSYKLKYSILFVSAALGLSRNFSF